MKWKSQPGSWKNSLTRKKKKRERKGEELKIQERGREMLQRAQTANLKTTREMVGTHGGNGSEYSRRKKVQHRPRGGGGRGRQVDKEAED